LCAHSFNRPQFDRNTPSDELALDLVDGKHSDQAKIGGAYRWVRRAGLKCLADLMEIDFLIAESESNRPTGLFDPLEIKNALIETACLFQRPDSQNEMVYAEDHDGQGKALEE
jgi:hypothetical protein